MNRQTHDFSLGAGVPLGFSYIPPQVEQLAWREREIASIVYRFGYATAKDVQDQLLEPVSAQLVPCRLARLLPRLRTLALLFHFDLL